MFKATFYVYNKMWGRIGGNAPRGYGPVRLFVRWSMLRLALLK